MKSVLVLGAGRSSSALIDYLVRNAPREGWQILVGDISLTSAEERVVGSDATAVQFNIEDKGAAEVIQQTDLVISLLPPHLHIQVARICLQLNKHLLTASYVSNEMRGLHEEAKQKNLLFLNECGLDPGIDHMSAMQVIDRIRRSGGELFSFESFTGGLIAPDTDPENPWRYKFTWNPRNVVMAGLGTARYLQNGEFKYIPHQQLFKRTTPVIVPGYGDFEGYANRDSLTYREAYGLQKIKTMLRGTLRNKGFCAAWNIFVQLGCTDDSYTMADVVHLTHHDFINSFLAYHPDRTVEEKIAQAFNLKLEGREIQCLNWSGMFDNDKVGLSSGTPAQILEHILSKRWTLHSTDRDMVVMWHRFRYYQNGMENDLQSSLVVLGKDSVETAMAKTVGLPLGIAAKLLLQGKIKARGVVIPVNAEFYEPIMNELKTLGIDLIEK